MSLWIWDVLSPTNEWEELNGGLGGITEGHDEPGVWFDAVAAAAAPENRLGVEAVSAEGGARVELLTECALAPRARELPVEFVLLPEFGSQLIRESLNRKSCEFGVHLLEDAHGAKVAENG